MLTIFILIALVLTLTSLVVIAAFVDESIDTFLHKMLNINDYPYMLYNLFLFTALFLCYFIASIATYNTFIK